MSDNDNTQRTPSGCRERGDRLSDSCSTSSTSSCSETIADPCKRQTQRKKQKKRMKRKKREMTTDQIHDANTLRTDVAEGPQTENTDALRTDDPMEGEKIKTDEEGDAVDGTLERSRSPIGSPIPAEEAGSEEDAIVTLRSGKEDEDVDVELTGPNNQDSEGKTESLEAREGETMKAVDEPLIEEPFIGGIVADAENGVKHEVLELSEEDLALLKDSDDSAERLDAEESVKESEIIEHDRSEISAAGATSKTVGAAGKASHESGFEGHEAIGGQCYCPERGENAKSAAPAAAALEGEKIESENTERCVETVGGGLGLDEDGNAVVEALERSRSPIGSTIPAEEAGSEEYAMFDAFGEGDLGEVDGDESLAGKEGAEEEMETGLSEDEITMVDEENLVAADGQETVAGEEEGERGLSEDEVLLKDEENPERVERDRFVANEESARERGLSDGESLREGGDYKDVASSVMQKDALHNAEEEGSGDEGSGDEEKDESKTKDGSKTKIFDDETDKFDGIDETKVKESGSDVNGFEGFLLIRGECKIKRRLN